MKKSVRITRVLSTTASAASFIGTAAVPMLATAEPGAAVSMSQPSTWSGPRRAGFALSGALGAQVTALGTTQPIVMGMPAAPQLDTGTALRGELFLGYKRSRAVVGVGLDLGGAFLTGSAGRYGIVKLLVSPVLQVALLRSADERIELLGALKIGLGGAFTGTPIDPLDRATKPADPLLLGYQIGPGIRYWPHPQLGATLLVGLAGEHAFRSSSAGTDTTGALGIFASLGALAIF